MRSILFALLLLSRSQDAPPALRVDGLKLVDAKGREVLLRGATVADPVTAGADFKRETFELLAKEWRANCIRIPVLPGSWKQKGADCDALLDAALGWCRELGVYAILDWHAVGNPATGKSFKDRPEFDSTMDLARTFWGHMAARHKGKPWVLFELFNEPMGVSWKELKPAVAELVRTVRAEAPDVVLLVPSPDYTYDLRPSAADPYDGVNLVYSWHVYPIRGASWDAYLAEARKKFPLMATEWGYTFRGDLITTGTTETFGLPLLAMMEEHRMHWTAAGAAPRSPTPLFADGGVTGFGRLVRAWLGGDRPKGRPALKDANDFAIWLQKLDVKALGESKFDLCVLDPENGRKPFTPDEVDLLKWSAGGPKILLAALDLGQIGPDRLAWQPDWGPGKPEWVGPAHDQRPAYRVRYWDEKWHKLLLEAVDRILAQGFDGLYLRGAEDYQHWLKKEKDDRAKPRLMELVGKLSGHGKRKSKSFLVVVQNGEEHLAGAAYLGAIDGIAREEVYFVKERHAGGNEILKIEAALDAAVKAGKKVFLIEYVKEQNQIDWVYDRAKAHGYVVTTPGRDLDALVVPKGREPD